MVLGFIDGRQMVKKAAGRLALKADFCLIIALNLLNLILLQ